MHQFFMIGMLTTVNLKANLTVPYDTFHHEDFYS